MSKRSAKKMVIRSRVTNSLKKLFLKAAAHARLDESKAMRLAAKDWAHKVLRRKALT